MNKGKLIVFSAPSGCGKGTMLAEITKDKNYRCSISATTRNPRPEDKEGVTYYFISNDEFEEKRSARLFAHRPRRLASYAYDIGAGLRIRQAVGNA